MYKALTGALAFFIAASIVDGNENQISQIRRLAPDEIGAYHTQAFEQLGEKYVNEKPQHVSHLARDLVGILAGYCTEDDSECKLRAYESTRDEFNLARQGIQPEIIYPKEFDDQLKNSINKIFEKVETLEELNLDEVLRSLQDIKDEIEGMDGVDETHKYAGLVGISVAMESSKLWHSTHYDETHPLHDMIHFFDPETGNRRLQFELPFMVKFDTAAVTIADVRAAIFNVVNVIGGDGQGLSLVTDVVVRAAAASAAAFAGSVSISEKNDDVPSPTQPPAVDDSPATDDDVFDVKFDDFLCGLLTDDASTDCDNLK